MAEICNHDDLLDVRAIIARVEELEDAKEDFEHDEDGNRNNSEWADAEVDDAQELTILESLLSDLKDIGGGDEEWRGDWYPVTLIRDSYFEDHARELVEDCGYISKDMPSWIEIDWKATARNVRMDYTSIEFEGVTYWTR